MLYDSFNRHIHYLRLSVTDRCNLRCYYCFDSSCENFLNPNDFLSIHDIKEIGKVCASLGIDKVRLTGGEPLLRKDIIEIVSFFSGLDGIKDLALTTNGQLLDEFALPLKKAGLHRVNISLDTLNPEKFFQINRGILEKTLKGIKAAKEAKLFPIKINCVKRPEMTDKEIQEMKSFSQKENLELRFIPQMNLKEGIFSEIEGSEGGKCTTCSRLRISSNGEIFPCLFSDEKISLKELGIKEAILKALEIKPKRGTKNSNGKFYKLGG